MYDGVPIFSNRQVENLIRLFRSWPRRLGFQRVSKDDLTPSTCLTNPAARLQLGLRVNNSIFTDFLN